MKNRLLRKLFAITLSLAFALSLTACTPEIHIHTGDGSSKETAGNAENSTVASTEESTTQNNSSNEKVETSVASSEPKQSSSNKQEATPSKATSSKTSSSSKISKSKAKSIALKDAGLKESEIYDYEIELDYSLNTLVYEISFEYNGKDYDYDINAKTGKIVSVEKPNASSSDAKISKSKAKSTALNHAGVKETDISRYQVELEKDDGVWKYEISFNVGNVEYDYTINAENGKILESEKDIDD